MNQKSFLALLIILLAALNITFSQYLEFDEPTDWEQVGICEFITGGSHKLNGDEDIWLFLKDRYNHHYLQAPKLQFTLPGKWEAPNLRGKNGIRYIVAIQVAKKGDKQIEKWVLAKRWDAIPSSEIEGLKGYRLLTQVVWPGCLDVDPICEKNIPTPLLIADFENGKRILQGGGEMGVWQSHNYLKMDWGIQKIVATEERGKAVANIKFPGIAVKGKWAGAGLVFPLKANNLEQDLRCYKTLELDLRMTEGSEFGAVRIKLEDSKGGNKPERIISSYGESLSGKWQHYSIPLEDLQQKKDIDAAGWESVDLKTAKRIVLVIVSLKEDRHLMGEIQIDNLYFKG